MRDFLCVPVSGPLGKDLIAQIRSFMDGVRVDVHPDDHITNWAQIDSFSRVDCLPIFLIAPGKMRRTSGRAWTRVGLVNHVQDFMEKLRHCDFLVPGPPRCVIEIGNEPDLGAREWKKNPREMGDAFADCFAVVRRYTDDIPVLCPSISNLDEDSLDYLERMAPRLPCDCGVAFHRYPHGSEFETPHDGFDSREHEVERLRKIAGPRQLWNTETGYAERNRDFDLNENEVAERMLKERRFWAEQKIASFCAYQINSAEISDGDDHDVRREKTYGFRRPDGSWKPIAEAWRREHEAHADER